MTTRSLSFIRFTNRHLFWMENGIDTMGLMKSLEEGKSKLVCSNTSAISDYDVDRYVVRNAM